MGILWRVNFSTLGVHLRNSRQVSNSGLQLLVKEQVTMKTTNLIATAIVSAGLAFGVTAQAQERGHEEQTINSSDVPAAVQQAAQAEAKGGTIVRWEKEGANFEAVIEKNGKQIGVEMDANGKVLSKHNEAKEHKEKGEKY